MSKPQSSYYFKIIALIDDTNDQILDHVPVFWHSVREHIPDGRFHLTCDHLDDSHLLDNVLSNWKKPVKTLKRFVLPTRGNFMLYQKGLEELRACMFVLSNHSQDDWALWPGFLDQVKGLQRQSQTEIKMKNTPSYLNASVRALLIDDKTEHLITNRPVVWYSLVHGTNVNTVLLLREDIARLSSSGRERKLLPLNTFSVFLHSFFEPETHSNTQLAVHAPGAHRDDVCSWPGFLKILSKTRAGRNQNQEPFFFDNRPSVIYSRMRVFQKSQHPKFPGCSRLRIGTFDENDSSGLNAHIATGCVPVALNK